MAVFPRAGGDAVVSLKQVLQADNHAPDCGRARDRQIAASAHHDLLGLARVVSMATIIRRITALSPKTRLRFSADARTARSLAG